MTVKSSRKMARSVALGAVAIAIGGPLSVLTATISNSSAGAATAAFSTPKTSIFCSDAVSETKNNVSAAASLTPSSIENLYKKLKSEEPQIISAAPSQLKGDFETIFTYTNGIYAELLKFNWNFHKVPTTYFLSLVKNEKKLTAASTAIESYLTKSCGLKEPST